MGEKATGKYSLLVPDGEYLSKILSPVTMHDLGLDMAVVIQGGRAELYNARYVADV